jgi:putative membrane protein
LKNTLLKEELFSIIKNKKALIPIIAILFIPVIYAGMFLWAFWDPYGKIDHLPVAIVNEDKGAELDGKSLTIGRDLVKDLVKSKGFKFHVSDRKTAYEKLKNEKYYMLIEIPEDFSKNATTLLDKNPKKLKLTYVPNEGFNFLTAKIGGTATLKIKSAVSEEVTKTYAETMFKKMAELADGVQNASDGALQLKDGSVSVKNGSNDINEGLATLAKKSIEFDEGMKLADSGVKKAASGSTALDSALLMYAKKSSEFDQGMKTASSGSKDLVSGSGEINNGLEKVDSNIPTLIAGTNDTYLGAKQLKTELPAGIASEIGKQLTGSVEDLNKGIDDFNSQLAQSLSKQIADQTIAQQTAKMQELANTLEANGVSPQLVSSIIASEQQNAPTKEQLEQQVTAELGPNLDAGFAQFKAGVDEKLTGESNHLEDQIKTKTDPYFDKLIGGIGSINEGQKTLQLGIHDLYVGSTKLNAGANDLSSGMNQLTYGADRLTAGANQLSLGSNDLKNGASDLSTGMGQLTAGADSITSGSAQLVDGSKQLNDGTVKLSDGAKKMAEKLKDGAKNAAKLHSDHKTYDMMADPVKLNTNTINPVTNYGTGFTPYFLSLGLFVGAMLLSIVFPMSEPAIVPASGFNWFTSKLVILAGIGIIQALIADSIILSVLHLHVDSVTNFVSFSIITSLTFVTLIQLLVTMFADAGRFLAIIILILQLTTSAGSYPIELIPKVLQPLNAYLPMTYAIRGFKSIISGGVQGTVWHYIMILVGYALVFACCTLAFLSMKYKVRYKDLAR